MAGLTARRGGVHRPTLVAGAAVAVGLVAWLVTIERMAGMDAGPGTELGALGWFLGVWATMMAAMMLPATAPVVSLFARTSGAGRTAVFAGGYLLVWSAIGLVAYVLYAVLDALGPGVLAWERGGPYVAGGAVVLAGLYQLTPLKAVCLRHCRSPLHFLLARSRPGVRGALRMGADHGLWCAGCCWALMLVLFAVGIMSLFWMAVIAGAILVEKALPGGARVSWPLGGALVALGVWIAVAPGSVPFLTEPGGASMTPMGM